MEERGDCVDCHHCCSSDGCTPSTPVHVPDCRHILQAVFSGGVGHPAERRPARKSTCMMVRNLMIFRWQIRFRGPILEGKIKRCPRLVKIGCLLAIRCALHSQMCPRYLSRRIPSCDFRSEYAQFSLLLNIAPFSVRQQAVALPGTDQCWCLDHDRIGIHIVCDTVCDGM